MHNQFFAISFTFWESVWLRYDILTSIQYVEYLYIYEGCFWPFFVSIYIYIVQSANCIGLCYHLIFMYSYLMINVIGIFRSLK